MQRRFFRSLFDLSFTSLVTRGVVKVLYGVSLVLVAIAYVVIAIALFTKGGGDSVTLTADGTFQSQSSGNSGLGLLWLFVLGPLFVFVHTLVCRVLSELVLVLLGIFEHTRDQLALARAGTPSGDEGPPASPA